LRSEVLTAAANGGGYGENMENIESLENSKYFKVIAGQVKVGENESSFGNVGETKIILSHS